MAVIPEISMDVDPKLIDNSDDADDTVENDFVEGSEQGSACASGVFKNYEEDKYLDRRPGRRKIKIEFINDKSRRHITFSKRKAGIMKKAYELSTLTGTQVLLLVASETGHVYTFATPKLQPLIVKPEGKRLIQACLNNESLPEIVPTPTSTDNGDISMPMSFSPQHAYQYHGGMAYPMMQQVNIPKTPMMGMTTHQAQNGVSHSSDNINNPNSQQNDPQANRSQNMQNLQTLSHQQGRNSHLQPNQSQYPNHYWNVPKQHMGPQIQPNTNGNTLNSEAVDHSHLSSGMQHLHNSNHGNLHQHDHMLSHQQKHTRHLHPHPSSMGPQMTSSTSRPGAIPGSPMQHKAPMKSVHPHNNENSNENSNVQNNGAAHPHNLNGNISSNDN